jgi:hypothetical protein
MNDWRRHVESALYPDLGAVAPHHRERVLKEAKEEPFDLIEWIGILLGLVLAVAATRYGAAELGIVERTFALIVNFAIAIPLLAVLVGPFLVRRTRRGLRRYLDRPS